MKKMKNIDIVFFALSRFDGPYSSISISLAKEFSKTNRVFYINHPYSLKDLLTHFKSSRIITRVSNLLLGQIEYSDFPEYSNKLTMVTPPLTLPINFLPKGSLYNFLQKVNDKIAFNCIRRLIKDKEIENFIFINTYDPFFTLNFPDDIKPYLKIYQCVDDIAEVPYTNKHGSDLERVMMKKFDITLTTSHELLKLKKAYSKNIYYLPNAVDSAVFNRAAFEDLESPAEFNNISKKVIGFIGNIEKRTNFKLLRKIADYHKDKLIYLVGPISDLEYKEEELDKMDNVIFTGGKNIEQLPNYLQRIDCAIIPFKCNKLTRSIYPLKVNEYLAGGKPVVTTNFSEDIRLFKDIIYIADTDEQFLKLIDKAIQEDNKELIEMRVKFSSNNTWANRVVDFWKIVSDYEHRSYKK